MMAASDNDTTSAEGGEAQKPAKKTTRKRSSSRAKSSAPGEKERCPSERGRQAGCSQEEDQHAPKALERVFCLHEGLDDEQR